MTRSGWLKTLLLGMAQRRGLGFLGPYGIALTLAITVYRFVKGRRADRTLAARY